MDKGKIGEPFHYSNTFLLLLLCYAKVYFHLPYRQTEGIVRGHIKGKLLPSIPDISTINRRINRMNIRIKDDDNNSNKRITNIEEEGEG